MAETGTDAIDAEWQVESLLGGWDKQGCAALPAGPGDIDAEVVGQLGPPVKVNVGGDEEKVGGSALGVQGREGSSAKVKCLTQDDVASGAYQMEHVVGGGFWSMG